MTKLYSRRIIKLLTDLFPQKLQTCMELDVDHHTLGVTHAVETRFWN